METTKRTSNGGHCGTDADGKIRISKPLAVGLAALFVGATVAVGLLVYNFADPVGGDNDDSVLATTMSPSTASPPQLLKDVRLPTHLKPLMYDVRLLPFVEEAENWRIDGYVKVYMSCTSPGRNVTLHLLEIVVDESSIIVENVDSGARVTVTDIGYDKARQFMTVNLGEDLRPGMQYSLEIGKFDAVLNDQLAGFYRSKYEHQGSISATNILSPQHPGQ
ncbi:unnamed protein product [Notodromas monacha]|uniref:Aminopeptidase N-like N-terminal domain-containing protein n=1 Tax=Notodromas monacha TaxID=399045 RepID=A0A7R9BYG2_9CRUS|nr:unnamed protein product [Notodromas monacha]CAG0923988.1 unnamed protein product [Notodromas monacha]